MNRPTSRTHCDILYATWSGITINFNDYLKADNVLMLFWWKLFVAKNSSDLVIILMLRSFRLRQYNNRQRCMAIRLCHHYIHIYRMNFVDTQIIWVFGKELIICLHIGICFGMPTGQSFSKDSNYHFQISKIHRHYWSSSETFHWLFWIRIRL